MTKGKKKDRRNNIPILGMRWDNTTLPADIKKIVRKEKKKIVREYYEQLDTQKIGQLRENGSRAQKTKTTTSNTVWNR